MTTFARVTYSVTLEITRPWEDKDCAKDIHESAQKEANEMARNWLAIPPALGARVVNVHSVDVELISRKEKTR